LATANGHESFSAHYVPIRNAVGAGDSMVASLAVGLVPGFDMRKAVCLGMAASAATLLTPGIEICPREDVERLFAETQNSAA
jgi:6-phosphofructokinase 2